MDDFSATHGIDLGSIKSEATSPPPPSPDFYCCPHQQELEKVHAKRDYYKNKSVDLEDENLELKGDNRKLQEKNGEQEELIAKLKAQLSASQQQSEEIIRNLSNRIKTFENREEVRTKAGGGLDSELEPPHVVVNLEEEVDAGGNSSNSGGQQQRLSNESTDDAALRMDAVESLLALSSSQRVDKVAKTVTGTKATDQQQVNLDLGTQPNGTSMFPPPAIHRGSELDTSPSQEESEMPVLQPAVATNSTGLQRHPTVILLGDHTLACQHGENNGEESLISNIGINAAFAANAVVEDPLGDNFSLSSLEDCLSSGNQCSSTSIVNQAMLQGHYQQQALQLGDPRIRRPPNIRGLKRKQKSSVGPAYRRSKSTEDKKNVQKTEDIKTAKHAKPKPKVESSSSPPPQCHHCKKSCRTSALCEEHEKYCPKKEEVKESKISKLT